MHAVGSASNSARFLFVVVNVRPRWYGGFQYVKHVYSALKSTGNLREKHPIIFNGNPRSNLYGADFSVVDFAFPDVENSAQK